MQDRYSDLKSYQDSFRNIDGDIHIMERSIPVELQVEYFRFAGNYKKRLPPGFAATDEQCEEWYAQMTGQPDAVPSALARDLLVKLAASRNPKAFNLLKQYVQQDPKPAELDWAYLALMESEVSLSAELSEKQQVYIATGLGGKGDKLRFYMLIPSKDLQAFKEYEKQVIEREFNYYFPKADCEVENLLVNTNYVELFILIPFRSDIRQLMARVIEECNEYGDFLASVYTITNVKILTIKEIEKVLEEYAERKDN